MTESALDHRIYTLGQSLGRLEGQVEALAASLQREHDERIAAMAEHEKRADATDKRVELVLDKLASSISQLSNTVANNENEIHNLQSRRSDGIDASRWAFGIGLTIILASASMYGSYRATQTGRDLPPVEAPSTGKHP